MSVPFDILAPLAEPTLADVLFPENNTEMDGLLAIHANWLADAQGLNTAQHDTPQRDTTVVGTSGSDTFVTTAGEDLLYGQTGNDTFLFENGAGVTTGDQLYGGGNTDRILLSGAGTYDFTADFQASSIEEIEFGADGTNISKTMILGSGELNGSIELANILIDGNFDPGSDDNIIANVTLIDDIDLSGWTFFDWDSSIDTITINGSAATNVLTGTSENDTINGLGGADTLYGGDGTDILNGGTGDDILVYNLSSGFDHYDGGADTDLLDFSGNTVDVTFNYDTQTYGSTPDSSTFDFVSIERVIASAAADTFIGATLFEYSLDGGAGIDTLDLSSDTDVFATSGVYYLDIDQGFSDNGGSTYSGTWANFENLVGFTNASVSMTGNSANNTLTGSSQNDTILGEFGNDILYGGAGDDAVFGGNGQDTLYGGTGLDSVFGGGDEDTLVYMDESGFDAFDGGSSTDTLVMNTNDNMTLDFGTTSAGDEFMADYGVTGGALSGFITDIESVQMAGTGNDTFIGAFIDGLTINGGAGADTIDLSSSVVDVPTLGTYVLDVDQGSSINNGASFNNTWSNIEHLITYQTIATTMIGNDQDNTFTGSDYGDEFFAEAGNDTVYGGEGNDVINAGTGTKAYYGGAGNDTIYSSGAGSYYGGTDNDTMIVASGSNETFDGGTGIDTLDMSTYNDANTIDLNTGLTTIAGESFLNFENVIMGNGTNSVTGTSGANTILGGTGSDTVNDGGGNDTVNLGTGDDRLILGDSDISGDSYDGGAGIDTFDATDFTWSADTTIDLTGGTWGSTVLSEDVIGFENIDGANNTTGIIETLIGTSGVNIINGNGGDDDIDGLGDNDVLNGGGGSDFINAGGGNDTVIGGTGKDDLVGGGGNDFLFGGDDNDTIRGGVGADSMAGGTGSDTLSYTSDTVGVSINLTANTASGGNATGDTIASFESVKAGSGDNTLIGTISDNAIISRGGNDSLYGLDGDDRIAGGGGDDLLRGDGGGDILNGGGGIDTLSYGTDTIGVSVDIGLNTASGGHATGDTISRFENLSGGTGDDVLKGSGGDNVIKGGSGNDRLSGRTGADMLIGGAGTDTLNGGAGNDTLTGGGAADVFIFQGTTDDDTITDFQVGIDTLKIYGQVEADVTFADAGGGDTLVTLASGDTILVENTSVAQLNTFDDFQFV